MTHAHITTWFVGLILFIVALGLHKSGKTKGFKIVHMILRLFYILILATGTMMLFGMTIIDPMYVVKSIVGLWVLTMLELVLISKAKGKKTMLHWILLIISLILVIYIGLKLPQGFYLP